MLRQCLWNVSGLLDLDDAAPLEDAEELAARQRLTRKPVRTQPAPASASSLDALPGGPALMEGQGPASSSGGDGWDAAEHEDTWAAFESSIAGAAPSPAKRELA